MKRIKPDIRIGNLENAISDATRTLGYNSKEHALILYIENGSVIDIDLFQGTEDSVESNIDWNIGDSIIKAHTHPHIDGISDKDALYPSKEDIELRDWIAKTALENGKTLVDDLIITGTHWRSTYE